MTTPKKDSPTVFHLTDEHVEIFARCAKDFFYFSENFLKIRTCDGDNIPLVLYPCQKRVIDSIENNRNTAVISARQMGKTTVLSAYALWCVLFKPGYSVGLFCNKEETASWTMRGVLAMLDNIPAWMKPGVQQSSKNVLTFDNVSRLLIKGSKTDGARGCAYNLILLDEFAFFNNPEEFFLSVYPIISSSRSGKFVVASTPGGGGSRFHQIVSGTPDNGFNLVRMDWNEAPGRDDKWKAETVRIMGDLKHFEQEFEAKFI